MKTLKHLNFQVSKPVNTFELRVHLITKFLSTIGPESHLSGFDPSRPFWGPESHFLPQRPRSEVSLFRYVCLTCFNITPFYKQCFLRKKNIQCII